MYKVLFFFKLTQTFSVVKVQMQQVLSGVMKALLSTFVNGAGHGDSSQGETQSVWVVGCREGRGARGWGRRGPARSGPAGVWGCKAWWRGQPWSVEEVGSREQPPCGRRPSLGRLGRALPLPGCPQSGLTAPGGAAWERRGTGLRRLGLTHKQVVPARGRGCGPDRVSPSPTGPGPPGPRAESSEGSGSAVVRRLSHPGGR